jgi:hypothetical protein
MLHADDFKGHRAQGGYMVTKSDIHAPLEDDRERDAPPLETVARSLRPVGHGRRRDDAQFEVVWSGIGPLPGAGGADGLGSTLSGIHFTIGRRG